LGGYATRQLRAPIVRVGERKLYISIWRREERKRKKKLFTRDIHDEQRRSLPFRRTTKGCLGLEVNLRNKNTKDGINTNVMGEKGKEPSNIDKGED